MAYSFKYQLNQAPQHTTSGSGMVTHDITAMAYENSEGVTVPGRHKTISVPIATMQTIMDMPDSTAQERQAKTSAYKDALKDNVDTVGEPIRGWAVTVLTQLMETNDTAEALATAANEYITVTLGLSYPVEFNL